MDDLATKCLICDDEVGDDDTSQVNYKGMQGLIKASDLRNDGKNKSFEKRHSGVVHRECRKVYTRPQTIRSMLKNTSMPSTSSYTGPSLRSQEQTFNYKTDCLFCGETIPDDFTIQQTKKPVHLRRKVYRVRALPSDNTIALRALQRGDEWGQKVHRRVILVNDLHSANAVYHKDCYQKFFIAAEPSTRKRGRPEDEDITASMQEIYDFIEGCDDCQFSFDELLQQVTGTPPDLRTIKEKMKSKYGDEVIFTTLHKRTNIITFRGGGEKVLTDAWYSSRCKSEQLERKRIVHAAAKIILEDVQGMAYDISKYPPADQFCREADKMVPETLRAFMDTLANNKKGREKLGKKMTAISHAIIAAIRPRSFISPILHGLALLIHRKYGAKGLVQLLSTLGFAGTYHEAQQLETSIVYHPEEMVPKETFTQYVFDNADFNIATLDGKNTFHSLGGIKCVTPASVLPPPKEIDRIKGTPSTKKVTSIGVLELQTYEQRSINVLRQITVKNLNEIHPISTEIFTPTPQDMLWMSGKWLNAVDTASALIKIPEWKAFMEQSASIINGDTSAVTIVPFINAPPSEYNTVHTALQYAAEQTIENGSKVSFVTFDQPLYIKAREIQPSNIAVRLGGFHTLMSYMGCIGQTMAGSGLKEVLSLVYATNTVDKMLTGHAYSRAVRGHFLVQAVLAQFILKQASISEEEKKGITSLLNKMEDLTSEKVEEDYSLSSILNKFKNEVRSIENNGPTAALWIQYFNMVTLMKKFIDCERRGDWNGHLTCVQQMIPFFHASGHFNYAKCAHLYVQDMVALQSSHPDVFEMFSGKGYFTINRSGSRWAGVWSDMTIEQTLMRSMKTSGGLVGRGFTDTVLSKWVGASRGAAAICSSVELFAGATVTQMGEQHVDFRVSRQIRDTQDRAKIYDWFRNHPPFEIQESIISLSTGIIGNSTVNCHRALEIGNNIMDSMVGCTFGDIKLSKKNVVLSPSSINNSVKVHGEMVTVDPLTIFQRTLIYKKNDEDVADLLTYELSPFPLSIYTEGGLRKGKKSSLYDAFPVDEPTMLDIRTSTNVIDGGFLLHRVKWLLGSTFSDICDQYLNYVIKHYGRNCAVIFDGYGNANSLKRQEQKRRCLKKTSVDIQFSETMSSTVQQEHFLGNESNKTRLIEMISQKLKAGGVETVTANGDADATIVRYGLGKASQHSTVTVIGEDIDLLVLLLALAPPDKNIFFMKPGKGKMVTKIYSTSKLRNLPFAGTILLLHAFSGCDTTSAIFNKGKAGMVKTFMKFTSEIIEINDVFFNPDATENMVAEAGEKLFLLVYQAPEEVNLNRLRHAAFIKASTKLKSDLAALPPTKGAARQHSLRVYLQIQQWLHPDFVKDDKLSPTKWGWTKGGDGYLIPLTTTEPIAPESILNNIFCGCKTGCGGRCGCRKAGIPCSVVCGTCHGACLNGPSIQDMQDKNDDFDEVECIN